MRHHRDQLSWLRRWFARNQGDGPPFALPETFDRISERWWRAHPRTRFSVVLALVVLASISWTVRLVASPYGAPESVIVATRQLRVGTTVQPGDIERQRWPQQLVPPTAFGIDESDLYSSQVVVGLAAGTVITREHVGQQGIASQLHNTERAVAVPAGLMPIGLAVGARLDLIARDLHGTAARMATDARVVAITDEVVWVAVNDADSPAVAATAAAGMLTATVRPT